LVFVIKSLGLFLGLIIAVYLYCIQGHCLCYIACQTDFAKVIKSDRALAELWSLSPCWQCL